MAFAEPIVAAAVEPAAEAASGTAADSAISGAGKSMTPKHSTGKPKSDSGSIGGGGSRKKSGSTKPNRIKKGYKTGETVTRPGYGNLAQQVKISRRLLVAEFFVCLIIVLFGHLAQTDPNHTSKKKISGFTLAKQATAVCVAFFMLSLLTAASYKVARIAAGIGGLMTLGLLLSNNDDIVWVLNALVSNSDTAEANSSTTQAEVANAQNQTNQSVAGTSTSVTVDRGLSTITTIIDGLEGVIL